MLGARKRPAKYRFAGLGQARQPIGRATGSTQTPGTMIRRRQLTSRVAAAFERLHHSLPTPIHWAAAELIADDPRRPRPRGTRARFIRALRRAARATSAAQPRFG
jgi:hypothetical protein